jgi:Helix-turn-helix domain
MLVMGDEQNGPASQDGARRAGEEDARKASPAGTPDADPGVQPGRLTGASKESRAGTQDPSPGRRQESAGADALALRALAHPVRWKLIDLLGSERSATATRCAEVLGESVASCSYHLGILAKYGYIELVPDQVGREKPWRLTSNRQDLSGEGLGVEGELAAEAATEAFLDHELARTKYRRRRRSLEPTEWREASKMLGSTMWVTAGELREISEELTLIAQRYLGRYEDPDRRPAGAREARVFFTTSVAPEPSSASEPSSPSAPSSPSEPSSASEPTAPRAEG